MGWLAVVFIVVPAVEIALLAEVGVRIGVLATLAVVIATGFIGAALARSQGFAVLRRIREATAAGRPPTDALIDGAMVLVAGTLLITPGILTDAVGFSLLIPPLRAVLKGRLVKGFEHSVRTGQTVVFFGGPAAGRPGSRPRSTDPEKIYEARFDDE